jgi:ubiquinone/menaquinone biosynthesis C-methylase UbiE
VDREQVFDEDYLYFYEPWIDDETNDRQANVVWELLELQADSSVLDLACGHGRIANRLAQRGATVTGLDATPMFLELALDDAKRRRVDVEYVEGDMRELPWTDRFDAVLIWFTSFGYFDDDDNRRVLRETYRALKAGGALLIENNNVAQLLTRALPWIVHERNGDFMIDRWHFDPVTSRGVTERIVIRDGRSRRFDFFVRMFIAAELRDWCGDAGFREVEFYDEEGAPLTAQSRRMITIARK